MHPGELSLVKMTVPESGCPWGSVFNGQQRHGITYRAAAVGHT
ncbi:hypothetical protein AB0G32_00505 [Streptomyces sp. NPDC023723]